MVVPVDDVSINREKTCPLLLRMFYSFMKHNNVMDYSRGRSPNNELQVYTWSDATLRELASLVKQVNPEARKRGTMFDFALVSPDQRLPTYRMREIGAVCAGSASDTDRIMLKDCQFTIGDRIDIAITPASALSNESDAQVARYPLTTGPTGQMPMMDFDRRRAFNRGTPPPGRFARRGDFPSRGGGGYANNGRFARRGGGGMYNDTQRRTVIDTSMGTAAMGGGGSRQSNPVTDGRRDDRRPRRIVPY